MMPYRLVLNCGINSRRKSAMNVYNEWSKTTTSAATPRNASSQPNRDGPAVAMASSNRDAADGERAGEAGTRGGESMRGQRPLR
ncbi:hypothetical protein GCM10018775_34670 [Streptomyces umbrinus]|nr:hypothetical protein GCM10018775_34670 [Streptomyces umbrinus]